MSIKVLTIALAVLAVIVVVRLLALPSQKDSASFQIQGEVSSNPYLYKDQIVFYLGRYKISAAYQNLEYGNRVAVEGEKQGLEISANKLSQVAKNKFEQSLFNLRKDLDKRISNHFPDPQGQLLTGILLGVKSNLSREFKASLVSTGTIHVVVVSGYNIVLVGSFILFLAPLFGRKKTTLLALATITLYSLLVGGGAPTIRALLMGGIALMAVLLGKRVLAVYALFLTAFVMLLVNPEWLFDVSFQLTLAATLGVLLFTAKFQRLFKKLPHFLSESLATTLAAQILVLPLIFYYFGQISLLSPIVNTLVLWTIPIATILGFIFLATTFVANLLANLVSFILILPLSFFTATVTFFGKISFIVLNLDKNNLISVLGYYVIVLAFGLQNLNVRRKKGRTDGN